MSTATILALKIAGGVLIIIALIASGIWLSLKRSDDAKDRVVRVDKESGRTTKTVKVNSRMVMQLRELARTNRRLAMQNRRFARANRRIIDRFGRVLVQARIAKRGRGGIRVTEAARGRTGAIGRAGRAGATGAAGVGVTRLQLEATLIPLLPEALRALCDGSCEGPSGEPGATVTREMVADIVRMVCVELGCGPGPQGPPGAPAPVQVCDPAQGYVCQPTFESMPTAP